MQILIAILIIFLILWLLGRIMVRLTEMSGYKSTRKLEEKNRRNIEKYAIEHENAMRPFAGKYVNSSFMDVILQKIDECLQGRSIYRVYISHRELKVDMIQFDHEGYVVHDGRYNMAIASVCIKYSDLGYQSVPDDDHLEGFAMALNSRFDNEYRMDINLEDIVPSGGRTPINNICLYFDGNIKQRHPEDGLKSQI